MINNNEMLSVVDEYDTPQKPMPRHLVKSGSYWFRAVHIWIVNHKNQVLVQKRSLNKDQSPGLWEPSVSGHLTHGDNYFTGAVREVREETGLSISEKDLSLVKIYRTENFKEYRAVFYCKTKAELGDIKSEKEEVDQVKFLHVNTLKKYLRSKNDSWIKPEYFKEMFSLLS